MAPEPHWIALTEGGSGVCPACGHPYNPYIAAELCGQNRDGGCRTHSAGACGLCPSPGGTGYCHCTHPEPEDAEHERKALESAAIIRRQIKAWHADQRKPAARRSVPAAPTRRANERPPGPARAEGEEGKA